MQETAIYAYSTADKEAIAQYAYDKYALLYRSEGVSETVTKLYYKTSQLKIKDIAKFALELERTKTMQSTVTPMEIIKALKAQIIKNREEMLQSSETASTLNSINYGLCLAVMIVAQLAVEGRGK